MEKEESLSPIYTKLEGKAIKSIDGAFRLIMEKISKDKVMNQNSIKNIEEAFKKGEYGSVTFDNNICLISSHVKEIENLIIGMLVLKEPFIIDEKPIQLITIAITSKKFSKLYVNVLSRLIKIYQDELLFDKLINSKCDKDIKAIIEETPFLSELLDF